MDDVSRVCDLSVGGLFLSTPTRRLVGEKVKLDFLVREGQIRIEAVVQHQIPNGGVGLKFTAITDRDCPNLVALMNRMRVRAASFFSAIRRPRLQAAVPIAKGAGLLLENSQAAIGP